MIRFTRILAVVSLAAGILATVVSAGGSNYPARIDLPAGFQTEGIGKKGNTFYVGSTQDGSIYRGDARTGKGSILVPAQTGRAAFGIFVDRRNRMWVAGGLTGQGYVYDARTGKELGGPFNLVPALPRFINDVVAVKSAAYFTDTSFAAGGPARLHKVPIGKHGEFGTPETITLPPELYGLNGIEAVNHGKTLLVVQFFTGKLYTIDVKTNAISEVVLDGTIARGDGLVVDRRTLYVVENLPAGDVAVITLSKDLHTGHVSPTRLNSTTDPLVNPATADQFGNFLYVVRRNAPGGTTFWLTRIDKVDNDHGHHGDGHGHKEKHGNGDKKHR